MKWEPGKTAPKDGKLFFCLFEGWLGQNLAAAIYWDAHDAAWRVVSGPDETVLFTSNPTSWMPIPKPPK